MAMGIKIASEQTGLTVTYVETPEFGFATLLYKRDMKPVYGFRIREVIPGKYHSDPVKNIEAHRLIQKTNDLADHYKKQIERRNFGLPSGHSFERTQADYNGIYE